MHCAQAELEAAVPILVDHLLVHASTDQKSSRVPFFCPLRTVVGQKLSLCTRFISNDDIDTALSRLNCVYESSSGMDEHTNTERDRDRDRDDLVNVRSTLPPSRSDCFRQVVGGGFRAGPRALPPWVNGGLRHRQAPNERIRSGAARNMWQGKMQSRAGGARAATQGIAGVSRPVARYR